MSHMRYLILILFLLLVTAALTCCQVPVSMNGSGGSTLLNNLTESLLNQTNDSLNATNQSTNLGEIKNNASDLWSWGTRPKNYSLYGTGIDYLSDPAINL
jgi:hypothetical protein